MTEIDPNSIKAGTYVLVALRWDEVTSKPGEPFDFKRHVQGDEVELSKSDARRLVLAGAVVKKGAKDKELEVPGSGQSEPPGGGSLDPDAGKAVAKPPTIDELLKDIGSDKVKAQAALDEENAQATPRTTLVGKLQAIIDAE